MQLVACARCKRHIRVSASRCPFCDADPESRLISRLVDGGARLSRAAVFAGAAACYTSPPPAQTPPPPPPPDQTATDSTATTSTGSFAKPPPGGPDASMHGSIFGVVHDGTTRGPLPNAHVALVGTGIHLDVNADAQGRFAFTDLPAGQYQIQLDNQNPRQAPPARNVQLKDGETQHVVIDTIPYVPDRGPCCKPYGAPPARRRVV